MWLDTTHPKTPALLGLNTMLPDFSCIGLEEVPIEDKIQHMYNGTETKP